MKCIEVRNGLRVKRPEVTPSRHRHPATLSWNVAISAFVPFFPRFWNQKKCQRFRYIYIYYIIYSYIYIYHPVCSEFFLIFIFPFSPMVSPLGFPGVPRDALRLESPVWGDSGDGSTQLSLGVGRKRLEAWHLRDFQWVAGQKSGFSMVFHGFPPWVN